MNEKKDIVIVYSGPVMGLNEMKAKAWYASKAKVDRLKMELLILCKNTKLPYMEAIELSIFYNSRHDVDNIAPMSKFFVDTIVNIGKLPNDTKKYFKKVSYQYDPVLPVNTIVYKIKILK